MEPVPILRAPRISTLLVKVEEAFAFETNRLPLIPTVPAGVEVPIPIPPPDVMSPLANVEVADVPVMFR